MNNNYNYILGLDMGVGSVGWACVLVNDNHEPYLILDLGSRIFDSEGMSVEDRRIARGTRRVLRRRKRRVQRTKKMFVRYHLLNETEINNAFTKNRDPYLLKLKGKHEALSYEELLVILVHYAKARGFKSNRKIDEKDASEKSSATEEQKLLFAKQKLEGELLAKQKNDPAYTITNYLLEMQSTNNRLRNTGGEYTYGITRKMVEEEVDMILNKQLELNLINEDFINEYKDILLRQRLFSEGPDSGPYHNPLNQMIGKCGFEPDQPRAPKSSYTYELFTLVQKLQDIRYHFKGENDKHRLTSEEVKKIIQEAVSGKKVTYALIKKIINKDIQFYGLRIARSEYIKIVKNIAEHPEKDLNQEIEKAKLSLEVYSLKQFTNLKKQLNAFGITHELSQQQYDCIADCLSRNKSDYEIDRYLNGERDSLKDVEIPEELKDTVKKMKDTGFKEFGKVSLKFLYNILPHMIDEGMNYYEACKACGYDHTHKKTNTEDFDEVPVINDILNQLEKTITNKAVVRTLVETRKVVNAAIHRYGKPVEIHIEMARELTKDKKERTEMFNEQQFNQIKNDALRNQIYSKHPDIFRTIKEVSSQDILKYRLFMEQGGICPYTLAITGNEAESRIPESILFLNNEVEIDHIIPYTKTFDDRYENKALVFKKRNSDKGNRIPLDYFKQENAVGLSKYYNWIKQRQYISVNKKERYFAEKIDERFMNDYRARTINDTRYAAKALKEILSYSFPSIKIKSYTGQITAKLRSVWNLNGLTHSMHEEDYTIKKTQHTELEEMYAQVSAMIADGLTTKDKEMKDILGKIKKIYDEDDDVKNRENHLHHALDAAVLACATDKIRRRVEIEEMVRRQKGADQIAYEEYEVDDDTGEVLETHTKFMTKEDYLNKKAQLMYESKSKFPLPYPCFDKEVILRVYEMNAKNQKDALMHIYKSRVNDENDTSMTSYPSPQVLNLIHPLFVSHHYASKVSGKLHKATYYGVKNTDAGLIMTERMSITSPSFDKKKLERIYDKNITQKYIYESVKEWLGDYKNGEEAFKAKHCLPKNKNGNEIKKVKLDDDLVKESFAIKKGIKQYVDKTDVVQVHVYTRDNDDKLYFVGMDRFRLLNIDKRDDLELLLWYGRDKNNITIKKKNLASEGFTKKPLVLHKGQTIYLETKSGKGLCQIIGFSSGMLEVESNLGDSYDLLKNGLTAKVDKKQQQITVSTIKSIKPISVDVLGKIHSHVL